ncbi:hypothetical protein GOBAR_AA02211 [Gossypium barbadense]|uniref:Uncharacterized protein n=1 Tax=Gossypium barbadense TaxID=3634 RepID=A0A2P5YRZ7_GOSBA|nr:hypothetical protein GOBAR_AA02211 [Gossypium barbadense]
MSSSQGQKAAIPASKKRKEASSFLVDAIWALLTTDPWELFFRIIEPTYLELKMELCSTFHLQTVMVNYNDPGTVQFCLGGLFRQLSIPEFASYSSTRSKASILPPSLRYLHAILAHTITGRHESTGVVNTHDAYFLRLLNTAAQESSITLIGQMSSQGIPSMLSMRMIERHRGTYPHQYHLAQSTKEKAYEDIPDDVPSQHEDPSTQPPPLSRPVYAATSYADISERLTRFEQQCFQYLKTLMLLYSRFFSTSTSHLQSHLANHPAMTMTYELIKLYNSRSILLHSQTDYSLKL